MFQFELLELLTLGVEVDACYDALNLVETYVVETFEAGSRNGTNAVIGH